MEIKTNQLDRIKDLFIYKAMSEGLKEKDVNRKNIKVTEKMDKEGDYFYIINYKVEKKEVSTNYNYRLSTDEKGIVEEIKVTR